MATRPRGCRYGNNGELFAVWISQGCFSASSSWPKLGPEGNPYYWGGSKDVHGRFCSVFPFSHLRTSGCSSVKWGYGTSNRGGPPGARVYIQGHIYRLSLVSPEALGGGFS